MANSPAKADVVIVGGGPSGLATALSLVRHAPALTDRLVVLERESYPREKICAGGMGGRADLLLTLLGVDFEVPSVPVRGISLRMSVGSLVERGQGNIGRVVRRVEFDEALATATRKRGIRLKEGVRVTAVCRQDSQWLLTTTQDQILARVVVGADGVGSLVRRTVAGPDTSLRAQAVEVDTAPAESDPERDLLHFEATEPDVPGYCWDFPTQIAGQPMVSRGAYVLKTGARVPDVWTVLRRHLVQRGLDPEAPRRKRFAERGYTPLVRVSWPAALLVGEAAGVDPITGEGIPQALAFGELAGRYLAERLQQGDLRFEDWPIEIRKMRFGFDLALRAGIAKRFYGSERQWLEHFVVSRPWFLRAGVEYFAGRPVPRGQLVRAGLYAAWLLARSRVYK